MTDNTEPTIDGLKQYFEANLLDGNDVYDCGGAMIRAEEAYEVLSGYISDQVAKAKLEAFDVAFDCHDYDRLRAYRAKLLKEVK